MGRRLRHRRGRPPSGGHGGLAGHVTVRTQPNGSAGGTRQAVGPGERPLAPRARAVAGHGLRAGREARSLLASGASPRGTAATRARSPALATEPERAAATPPPGAPTVWRPGRAGLQSGAAPEQTRGPPPARPPRRRTGCGSEREHAARSGRRRAGLAGRRAKQRARRPARRPPLRPCRTAKRTPPASDHGNPHRPPNLSQGPSRGGRFGVRRVVARPLDTRGTRPRAPRTCSGCGSARPPLGGPAPRAALGVAVGGARG